MRKKDIFDIIKIPDRYPTIMTPECWEFKTPQEVGTFMWGRSTGQYIIYKNGELAYLHHLYANISELEIYLSGDITQTIEKQLE